MWDRITTKNQQKCISKNYLHFNAWNKYLIPYPSARFLAPRCLLYRQGAEIRSTLLKGVSACYLYKRPVHRSNQSIRFQTPPPWPRPKSCPRMSGQDCRPTQGWNGLQDHHQAAWREGDNSWCNYSQMEETQNNCQSPSVWGSMEDLTSWSFNDHENGEESAQNYMGGSCQWSQGRWDQKSPRKQLVTHYAMKDWNPAAPARSPCSRKHKYRPVWSLPMNIWMIQRRTGWKCCDQMRPKSSSLASNQLAVFGGAMLLLTPRTPSSPSNMEVETLCFGGVFLAKRTGQTAPH